MRAAALRALTGRTAALLLAVAPAAGASPHPALDPPVVGGPEPRAEGEAGGGAGASALQEWVLHRSADGRHPDGREQAMLWLMNRAREDPSAEGLWLATEPHLHVSRGRRFFDVDTALLRADFDALRPTPPAAFDRRLYEAARAHSLDLVARDAQDHVGQFAWIDAFGFDLRGARGSVFSFADSALNAHAAFNIDWGPNPTTGMQEPPGHRLAIMGAYDNVGIAMVPEDDPATSVGPFVVSANYAFADASEPEHHARFLVGTVWEDEDGDGLFDPGEGFGGVEVMPGSGPFYAVTASGGGYALPITAPGTYSVRFSGGELPFSLTRTVTVGSTSELLDARPVPEPAAALRGAAALGVLAALRRGRARRGARTRGEPSAGRPARR